MSAASDGEAQQLREPVDEQSLVQAYTTLIAATGEPVRDGLRETPARAARAWRDLTSGYTTNPTLTTFDAEGYDQIVALRDIGFYSLCEHHLLPFYGQAHIAYLPGDRILGLSKFARVVDAYARRLQVQEHLTQQVADALEAALAPAGLLVVLEAEHLCMAMRGIKSNGSTTRTSYASGTFRTDHKARAEALALLNLT
jgi:GTP cyclohydrolase IA